MRVAGTLMLLLACGRDPVPQPFQPEPRPEVDTPAVEPDVEVMPPETPTDPEAGPFDGFPCAEQRRCAPAGPFVDETCCAVGDAIGPTGSAAGAETVGLTVGADYIVACGGFGAQVSQVTGDVRLPFVGTAGPRCQHAAFGPELPGGARVAWLAHHGDTWVSSPTLWTFALDADDPTGPVRELQRIEEPGTSFGGLVHHEGYVHVALHRGGIRTYRVLPDGQLEPVGTLSEGLDNVRDLVVEGEELLALDGEGLARISLTDPAAPVLRSRMPLRGTPRALDVHDGRVWVALGALGVDAFDLSATSLTPVFERSLLGSAQDVAATSRFVAVAAWDHVALLDPGSGVLLGTERATSYPHFEQDLAIDVLPDERIVVGEWEGTWLLEHTSGLVAPDVWSLSQSMSFDAEEGGLRTLDLVNRGPLPLQVEGIDIDDPAYRVPAEAFELPPHGTARIEVALAPPPLSPTEPLRIASNDPDADGFTVPIHAIQTANLVEGDVLHDAFGFLDPTGAGQVDNMRGDIWLLAYFALF